MKKIIALLLALVLVFSLAACAGDTAEDTTTDNNTTTDDAATTDDTTTDDAATDDTATDDAATDDTAAASDLNVGVFYYTYDDVYISSVRAALDEAWAAAGITYTNNDCKNDQATQNDLISTAVTNGCNLLVVNLVNSGSAEAAQKVVELAGDVPVVFFNRAVEGEGQEGTVLGAYENVCFIGTDAPEAGHLQGQMIGEYLLANYDTVDLNGDGVISYAMFKGQEGNAEAEYRTQFGVEDADAVLTEAGKPALEYFDANNTAKYQVDQSGAWSTQAALDYMSTNLSQYNEANGNMIELVICNNDGMAEGVVKALNAAGYNNADGGTTIPVFGVDATDSAKTLIADGKMTGTVKQDAEGMASAICSVVTSLGQGTAMADSVAAAAATDAEKFSVAEGVDTKLYVAYAPYTA